MIGTRIKTARKKAGLSLRALAAAIDHKVTAQAIGKYERNESVPSSGVLIALSKVLGVSIPFLLDTQGVQLIEVDFRTKASTSAKDRAQVEVEVVEWVERYLQIETILGLEVATWNKPFNELQCMNSISDAEKLAHDIRQAWNLGQDPIPNMTELLEEKGLKVLVRSLPARVSGLTCLVNRKDHPETLPVIVVNQAFTLERRRLTLAHELAHRVIDPKGMNQKDLEKAATRFAGAFLVPKEHLLAEVGKIRSALGYRELVDLKRLYRVSASALLVRLRDIEVISDSIMTYVFQQVASTWRTKEPEPLEGQDDQGQQEIPKRFERLCYRALAEGFISVAKAAELLRRPVDDVIYELRGPNWGNAHSR